TLPEETGTASVVSFDVLANDHVLGHPSDSLSITGVVNDIGPNLGVLAVSGDGKGLEFTAASNVSGQSEYVYTVVDAAPAGTAARTAQARVTIRLTQNTGLQAHPDTFVAVAGSTALQLDVLPNDLSIPHLGRPFAVTAVTPPDQGGLVNIVSNKLIYTPQAAFVGDESFLYTFTDGFTFDSAEVTVRVQRGLFAANPNEYRIFFGRAPGGLPLSFTLPVVLNDGVLPSAGEILEITGVGINDAAETNAPSLGGSVEIAPNGRDLIYRPNQTNGFPFVEQFTYILSDGSERRAEAIVRIEVQERADVLTALTRDDAFSVDRNSSLNSLDVLANDNIKPGSASVWTLDAISTAPSNGVATVNGARIRYTPNAGFVGQDQFSYAVSDGFGGTGIATVNVNVGDQTVCPDLFVVISGSESNALDVLANDALLADWDEEYTLHSAFGTTMGGTVSVSSNGVVLYTPATGAVLFPYTEIFQYRVDDDSMGLVTGTAEVVVHEAGSDRSVTNITIVVQGVNDPPTIANSVLPTTITDKQTAWPFTGVTLTEVDQQLMELIDVEVSLPNPAQGVLTHLGTFMDLGAGRYVVSNVTAAFGTSELRQLVFMPTENRITVPTTEVTYFTVAITDNKAPFATVSDTNSMISVTATNDPPTISGTVANQEFFHLLPIRPFSAVTIGEVDDLQLQPLNVKLTIDQASNGNLSNLGSFIMVTNGVYNAPAISAADVTAELREILFSIGTNDVEIGGALLTTFSIMVNDGFSPSVNDLNTSVVALNPAETVVQPTNTVLQGSFGLVVDAIDDFSIVGAPNAEPNGTKSGTAFIYKRTPGSTNDWQQWRQLQPLTVNTNDRFGRSVCMTESFAAVGAINADVGPAEVGVVYLFERHLGGTDNWGERIRIAPAGITNASRAGLSVCIEGDLLVIGAPDASLIPGGPETGAVFVYKRNAGGPNAWGEVYRWAPGQAGNDTGHFGWSVALTDRQLAVGAPQFNTVPGTTAREGAAFLFSHNSGASNSWTMVQMLASDEPLLSSEFGWDVSLHPELLAVGAPSMRTGGVPRTGRVYLYEPTVSNMVVATKQLDRRLEGVQRFGHSISVKGTTVFVGAPENAAPQNLGAAYLYGRDVTNAANWVVVTKLLRPLGSPAGLFGTSVSFKRGTAAVGAPANLSSISNRGFAFFYRFGGNRAPIQTMAIPDIYATVGVPFSYAVPPGTFIDPDADDVLTYKASFPGSSNGLWCSGNMVTGTPVAIGITLVDLVVSDRAGAETNVTIRIVVQNGATPFSTIRHLWNVQHFGTNLSSVAAQATLWGGAADPDGDNLSNDQEYVFGRNPSVADSMGLTFSRDGNGNFLLSYTRRINDPGLVFGLEGTSDLVIWGNAQSLIIAQTRVPVGTEFERVSYVILLVPNEPTLAFRVTVNY
ncbi:MAG: hypothetical protein ACI856_002283, partial [Kiritimatiellia bacterium]